MNYSKIPIVGNIYRKIKENNDFLKNQIALLKNENIKSRFYFKNKLNEKINVVFVCWRPAIWGSLKTVYEEMSKDDCFSVKILVIPNKKELPDLGWNHNEFYSEGGEKFWKGENIIQGYNYESHNWLDLKFLNPDYVFFQQPYNNQRPSHLNSSIVSSYAKICYVAYYAFFNSNTNDYINEGCTPEDFMKDVSYYFSQNQADFDFITSKMKRINNTTVSVINSGFPRYDSLESLRKSNNNKNKFNILWTPRWALDEGNCHFFVYKDNFLSLCMKDSDIDLVLRPHPQAFLNYIATGAISAEKLEEYKNKIEKIENARIDYSESYIETFNYSDCLITDTSSMVAEYFLTGKPIIYCYNKNSINSFSKSSGYTSSFYFVETWEELLETLYMLKSGNDPLQKTRKEFIDSDFYLPKEGSGKIIKEIIKNDFKGEINV